MVEIPAVLNIILFSCHNGSVSIASFSFVEKDLSLVVQLLCLPACLSVCVRACLPACVPARLSVCLPAWLPVCLPACLPGWLLQYLFGVSLGGHSDFKNKYYFSAEPILLISQLLNLPRHPLDSSGFPVVTPRVVDVYVINIYSPLRCECSV